MSNKKRSAPSGPVTAEKISATMTGAITGATAVDIDVTVAGVVTTDVVTVSPVAALPAGCGIVSAHVSAADTVKVRVMKVTAGDIASADYAVNVNVSRYTS